MHGLRERQQISNDEYVDNHCSSCPTGLNEPGSPHQSTTLTAQVHPVLLSGYHPLLCCAMNPFESRGMWLTQRRGASAVAGHQVPARPQSHSPVN